MGNDILVGAPTDSRTVDDGGAAYLFDVDGNLLQIFEKPVPAVDDILGNPVAAVGDNILIAAPGDDTAGLDAGAVYLFDRAGNLLETFLNPNPNTPPDVFDIFGVSIAAVGNDILIGANQDRTVGPTQGVAYLFDGDPSSAAFGDLLLTIPPPNVAADHFGVAVAAVGDKLLVGAMRDGTLEPGGGAAYLFDRAGNLLHTFLTPDPSPSDGSVDEFGAAVAAVGGNVLIGARLDDKAGEGDGAVYLFRPVLTPPSCDGPPGPFTVEASEVFSAQFTGIDPDGDALTVEVTGLPAGEATLNPSSGFAPLATTLRWTPLVRDVGEQYTGTVIFTDSDNLRAACTFEISVTGDTDGDGLPDDWEENGVDCDGDGTIDLPLDRMGVGADMKDIFVEIDYMDCVVDGSDADPCEDGHNHKPDAEALDLVIAAFKKEGIRLHIDVSEALPHDLELGEEVDGAYSWDEFDAIKNDGIPFSGTSCPEIPPGRNPHFDPVRRRVFHYGIFAHNLGGKSYETRSGISRRPDPTEDCSAGNCRGSTDFIVSLGPWKDDDARDNVWRQAGACQHYGSQLYSQLSFSRRPGPQFPVSQLWDGSDI